MKIRFLEFKTLEEDTPVCGIEVFDNDFFYFTENSNQFYVGDKDWHFNETLSLETISDAENNVLKPVVLVKDNKQPSFLILQNGDDSALLNLKTKKVERVNLSKFRERLHELGMQKVQYASASLLNDRVVICNKTDEDQSQGNGLIFTNTDFWRKQDTVDIFKSKIEFEQIPALVTTVTAVTYSYENDWLIVAATATNIPGDGDSTGTKDAYLGIIENAYRKADRKRLKVNEVVNLSEVDQVFSGQEIRSIAIQADKKNKLKLHLASRDHSGNRYLLRVRIKES